MTTTPDATAALQDMGANDHQLSQFDYQLSQAIHGLEKVARMATELAADLDGPVGHRVLFKLSQTASHTSYSNTLAPELAGALTHLAMAQGMVESIAAGRPE